MGGKGRSKLPGLLPEEAKLAAHLKERIQKGEPLDQFTRRELALVKVKLQSQIERHQEGFAHAVRWLGLLARHEKARAEDRGQAAEC